MLFNSIEFLIFLPIVFVLYWFVFNKNVTIQNLLILISSYVFYGWWDYRFLSLIFLSTVVDYFIGLKIPSENDERKRKFLLWCSVLFNLSILGFFKYYNFFIESWVYLFTSFGYEIQNVWTLNIILPVGISFYTFQTMSYTIDIYYKKLAPTKDFIAFASFVSFFPQLVAGPIEKAHKLLPQIISRRDFSFQDAKKGIFLITYGLFKKVVVADNLSVIVDYFYANVELNSLNTTLTFASILFYSLQIYCDFSGYSDIAIGVSKLFGINLSLNFNQPYFSANPIEFWRRWHISLSTWFRDYVFIPLGGSRISHYITLRNVLVVFLVSGLWHGSDWKFVLWGFGHFIIYLIAYLNKSYIDIKINKGVSTLITFISVSLLWIPFRALTISDAFVVVKNLFSVQFMTLPFGSFVIGKLLLVLVILFVYDICVEKSNHVIRNIFSVAFIIILIFMFGNFTVNSFIYFQF